MLFGKLIAFYVQFYSAAMRRGQRNSTMKTILFETTFARPHFSHRSLSLSVAAEH